MLTALAASNSAPNQLPSPDLTSSSPSFHQANPSVSSTSAATPQWPFENGKTNVHLSSTSAKSLQHPTRNFKVPLKAVHEPSATVLRPCPPFLMIPEADVVASQFRIRISSSPTSRRPYTNVPRSSTATIAVIARTT